MDTTNTRTILASIVLASLVALVKPDCAPVHEGSSAFIDCSVTTVDDCEDLNVLTWTIRDDGGNAIFSFPCSTAGCDVSYVGFTASISGSSPNFTSTFSMVGVSSIWPVELIGGSWECQAPCSDDVISACPELEFYVLPTDPECTATELFGADNVLVSVNLSCTTNIVYPGADCIFYDVIGENDPVSISGVVPDCQLVVPAANIAVGTHRFMGRLYPSVTGGDMLEGIVNTVAVPDIVIVPMVVPEDDDDDGDDDLIIGLICGGAGLLLIIAIVICCCVQRNKKEDQAQATSPQRPGGVENWTLKDVQSEEAQYQHVRYSMDPTMGEEAQYQHVRYSMDPNMGEQTQSLPQAYTPDVGSWSVNEEEGNSATYTFDPTLTTKL